jgi:hypothetical protein
MRESHRVRCTATDSQHAAKMKMRDVSGDEASDRAEAASYDAMLCGAV